MNDKNFVLKIDTNKVKSTTLKYSPMYQSSEISDPELKMEIDAGDSFDVVSYDEVAGHYKLMFTKPYKNRKIWFGFAPHLKIYEQYDPKKNRGSIVNLAVPYYSQRDNALRPHQTCNMTSAAMVIEFLHKGTNAKINGQLEDHLTRECVRRYGFSGIYYHNNIVRMLKTFKVRSRFDVNTSFHNIRRHLDKGYPVIYSGKFTKSGHIIVIRGYDKEGFYVNDPWGEWFYDGYYRKLTGENKHYSNRLISNVSYSGQNAGWAHLCDPL